MEKIKSILLFGAFKTIKSDGISVQYLEVLKKKNTLKPAEFYVICTGRRKTSLKFE